MLARMRSEAHGARDDTSGSRRERGHNRRSRRERQARRRVAPSRGAPPGAYWRGWGASVYTGRKATRRRETIRARRAREKRGAHMADNDTGASGGAFETIRHAEDRKSTRLNSSHQKISYA